MNSSADAPDGVLSVDPEDNRSGAHSTSGHHPLRICLIALYICQGLGLRQISSALRARGHETHLIFFKEFSAGRFREVTCREEEMLVSLLRELNPQLVGMSLMSSFVADLAYGIAGRIKAALGVPVVVGGAHASALPEECLEHVDFVCLGEGEEAVGDLADALAAGEPADRIPNIWTKVDGEVRRNDLRPLTQDLDVHPPISYGEAESYFLEGNQLQKVDPGTLEDTYQTTTSRMSCPFQCSFCAGVWLRRGLYANKGRVCRYRSVDHVLQELREARAKNPAFRLIWFWDEIFGAGAPKGWLDEFCRRYPREIGLPFEIWYHPAMVTDKRMAKLSGAGLSRVWMGIESGSERVRREVLNRRETNDLILRAAAILQRYGIGVGWDFILDIPWLTEENCRGTFDLLLRLPRPFTVHFHSLSLLPGAALTERALAEGLIRPEQVALADRPIVDRFASHFWQYRLEVRDRKAAFWHSLIYLASLPSVPRSALRRARQLQALLRLDPRPLILAAEVARIREETGQTKYFPALMTAYPSAARFLARHPTVGRAVNRAARTAARAASALCAPGSP